MLQYSLDEISAKDSQTLGKHSFRVRPPKRMSVTLLTKRIASQLDRCAAKPEAREV
jgi:hypothetical protein